MGAVPLATTGTSGSWEGTSTGALVEKAHKVMAAREDVPDPEGETPEVKEPESK